MLNIVKFKGCKRCGGDLFLERDAEGAYIACLQCGAVYVRHLKPAIQKPLIAKPTLKKLYAR
jgi:DNA-directed RNA polymerase subunit RPC12/RpoP